jgi:hypothetical protein
VRTLKLLTLAIAEKCTVYQELTDVTDQAVASDLYEADGRAGYWRENDPSLTSVLARIQQADWGRV